MHLYILGGLIFLVPHSRVGFLNDGVNKELTRLGQRIIKHDDSGIRVMFFYLSIIAFTNLCTFCNCRRTGTCVEKWNVCGW